jgi:hypothetical protein
MNINGGRSYFLQHVILLLPYCSSILTTIFFANARTFFDQKKFRSSELDVALKKFRKKEGKLV